MDRLPISEKRNIIISEITIIDEVSKGGGKLLTSETKGRGKEFCNFFAGTANCSFEARGIFSRVKSHYRVMEGLINSTRRRNGVNRRDAGSWNKCPLTVEDKSQGRERIPEMLVLAISFSIIISRSFSEVLLFHSASLFLKLRDLLVDALCFIT